MCIFLISIFVTSLANVMFSFVTCSKVMMLIIFTVIRLLLCHLFDTYAAFQLYNVFLLIINCFELLRCGRVFMHTI